MPPSDASGFAAALDALIPGNADWPAASDVVDPTAILERLTAADRAWLASVLARPEELATRWDSVEGSPAFARLLRTLYDAYYSAPGTAPRLRALAEASPRDPDSRFDPALLNRERTSPMQSTDPATGITLASPPDVARASTYEHASRCGDFIFVAGQVARDENNNWVGIGDARAQAVQVYKNIGRVLAQFGAGPEHVVKINAIMVDRNDRDAVTEPRLAFFGDHRPPHTGIVIAGLGSPEVKIEVEVVAYLPRDRA